MHTIKAVSEKLLITIFYAILWDFNARCGNISAVIDSTVGSVIGNH